MCGIIGYTGTKAAAPLLLEGLSRLEYRGYDSAGIAVMGPSGETVARKSRGKLAALRELLADGLPEGTAGIGHTRWATHGGPTDENAHPHTDCGNEVAVVHNGIVENFVELRQGLQEQGHVFSSETDSECIPHLIESVPPAGSTRWRRRPGRPPDAFEAPTPSWWRPGAIPASSWRSGWGTRAASWWATAGARCTWPATCPRCCPTPAESHIWPAERRSPLRRRGASYTMVDDGRAVRKQPTDVPYDSVTAAKGEYKHFMLKEIHEQPEVVVSTMRGRVSFDRATVELEEFPLSDAEIMDIDRVVLIGMGTSMHAAMVGRHWIESLARIPAEADNSSEFRYRDPIIDERTLVVSVCQSGETADTLAAMGEVASRGGRQVTLCNYDGTQATRIAEGTMLIRAGLEIGVAASKTFVCSLTSLYLLAMYLGIRRGALGGERLAELTGELAHLPRMLGTLVSEQAQYERLAGLFAKHSDFLYLGRGVHFPLAMEGALKLKEVSYIHAEGYPAGEMKHGPISLIDESMPVVALAPQDELYEKMLSNVNEAKARGGRVIAVATEGDDHIAEVADHVVYVPRASPLISPILLAIPMQLLAYYIAVRRGCDIDQPRNLAKSVTVE